MCEKYQSLNEVKWFIQTALLNSKASIARHHGYSALRDKFMPSDIKICQ